MILHVVNVYIAKNQEERERNSRAAATWNWLYAGSGGLIRPCHVRTKDLERTSLDIGDPRALPYVRDLISWGFKENEEADGLFLTNADSALVKETGSVVWEGLRSKGAIWCHRRDSDKPRRVWLSRMEMKEKTTASAGVDLVGLTRSWWERVGQEAYPDLLLGCEGWDWVFRFMIGTEGRVDELVYHEQHEPTWHRQRLLLEGQLWNRRLCRAWLDALDEEKRRGIERVWKTAIGYTRA